MTSSEHDRPSLISRGFVLVHEILCGGLVPAEWDGDGHLVVYATRAEAERELRDTAEIRADAMDDGILRETDDEDRWIEFVEVYVDGFVTLINQFRTYSASELRAVWQ